MSKKTKRIAKGLGASALAIATIASGLSFGATAASAAPAGWAPFYFTADETSVGAAQWDGTLPPMSQRGQIYSFEPGPTGISLLVKHSSAVAAEADAMKMRYSAGRLENQNNQCLSVIETAKGLGPYAQLEQCGASQNGANSKVDQRLSFNKKGQIVFNAFGRKVPLAYTLKSTTSTHAVVNINGGATAGGQFAPATLTATGSFPSDNAQRAQITGKAEANATVVVKMGSVEVGRVTANADGDYTFDVPAPMQGGTKTYTVSQIANGTESGNIQVSLNYGTAVSITSHSDGDDADAGPTTISGAGENGSSVTVALNGTDLPAQTVSGGRWSVAAELRRGENTIVATQKSKGANTTTSTVVVNPGDSTTIPFSVTTPTNNSTVSGPTVGFTGRAEPGTQVRIVEGGTTVMTRVDTDANGDWTGTSTNLTNGVHNLTVQYTEPGQGQQTQPLTITVQNGVVQPFSITEPTDGATVPSGPFTIKGLATSGTKVNVVNSRGQIVMTTTDTDLAGDWSGRATLPAGTHRLTAQYLEPGAQKRMVDFTVTVEGGVTQPFRVTGPADGATVNSNTFDVTGIGTTGTVVNAVRVGNSNLIMPTTKIDDAGNWAGQITLPNGTHNITVQYLEPGTGSKQTVDLTVTVEGGTQQPFAVSTPADGDVINSNNFEFTGVGSTGTTVNVVNKRGGVVMASTTIGADGTWTGAATLPNGGPHEVTVQYMVPGTPGKQTVQMSLTVVGGVNQPFEVTSPADGDVVSTNPQGTVTFTGKASTGTMVNVVRNGSTTPVVPTLTVDASGNWTGTANLPDGTNGLTVQYIEPGTPGKQSMPLTITVERATVQPFAFTSHQDGDVVTAGAPVTFAGTGTTGTKVNVINVHGNTFMPELTIGASGNWSGQSVNIPRGTHSLMVQYTEPGVPGKQSVNFRLTAQ